MLIKVSFFDTLIGWGYLSMSYVNGVQLKEALKLVMRQQKKTYLDLAKHLKTSEVTVKRFMSKEEINLSRMLEICNWLDLNLSQLEKIALNDSINKKVYFTEKQESFLVKNPQYLAFLFHLYADENPEKIQKKFKISDKSLNLYLLRLEKFDLIYQKNGKYVPVHPEFPSPIMFGELLRESYKKIIEAGALFFKNKNFEIMKRKDTERNKGFHSTISVFDLNKADYFIWLEKYKALYQELDSLAKIQNKVPNLKDKKAVVLMHLSCVTEADDSNLESIKDMFGYVSELTS